MAKSKIYAHVNKPSSHLRHLFFHTKIISLFSTVSLCMCERVRVRMRVCECDVALIKISPEKRAQKCSKHKIQNEEEINREAHACWPNIIFEWRQFNRRVCKKKPSQDEETTYGWKQRDGKKKIHLRRMKRTASTAPASRRSKNTSSQTNQVRIRKCECLMNWKKLRIQFTFEFIFHSFLFDLKLCANPTDAIHSHLGLWMRPIISELELVFVFVSLFFVVGKMGNGFSSLADFVPSPFFLIAQPTSFPFIHCVKSTYCCLQNFHNKNFRNKFSNYDNNFWNILIQIS